MLCHEQKVTSHHHQPPTIFSFSISDECGRVTNSTQTILVGWFMRGNTTHRLSGRPCPWLCLHFSVQSKSGQTDYLAPEIKETRWEDKASKSKLMSLNPQGTELSIIIPTPLIEHVILLLWNLPVWRPFLLASSLAVTRLLEWTTAGFFMIRPSFCKRATLRRELAKEISLTSLGSSQILRFPHLRTDAARRFWSLRETKSKKRIKTKRVRRCSTHQRCK